MGQLEKYALYVLCLVIFLIFGVSLFGGDAPAGRNPGTELNAQAPANGTGAGGTASARDLFLTGKQGDGRAKGAAQEAVDKPVGDRPVGVGSPASGKPAGNDAAQPGDVKEAGKGTGGDAKGDAARPTHTVVAGDTYTSIAKKLFGSPVLVGEIARLNPAVNPAKLKTGQTLLLPTKAEVERLLAPKAAAPAGETRAVADGSGGGSGRAAGTQPTAAGAAQPGSYIVAKNDTLESIALSQLGSRKRVDELRALNPDVDPTRMRVGMPIRLPKR